MPISAIETRIESLTREVEHLRASRSQADSRQNELMLKITEIQLNLATQDKTLVKLESAINGNGKPGLMTRLDRIERLTAGLTRTIWVLVTAAIAGAVRMVFERIK